MTPESSNLDRFTPLSLSLSRDSGGNEVLSSPDRSNYSYSFDEDEETFPTPGGQEFDWNTPFQACLNSKESAQKYLNIVRLISDFVEVSSVYGKIIISESNLVYKTITPIPSQNTSHGGDKYFVQGIVFKFGNDQNISQNSSQPEYLFGGTKENMERAMKTISNELKGMSSYFFCDIPNTFFPLATSIDFHGYRLLAATKIPIIGRSANSQRKTLKYGSDDGGITIVEDSKIYELTKKFGLRLNQAPHSIIGAKNLLYGPFDLEYHSVYNMETNEENIYLLDFGRVLPPGITETVRRNRRFDLFQLLRPNFANSFHIPLPVDLQTIDDCNKSKLATLELISKAEALGATLNDKKTKKWKPGDIIRYMHKKGINARYIGVIRNKIPTTEVFTRKLFLIEIIARSLKNEIKSVLREKMKNYSLGTRKSIYTDAIHNYLEKVFSWPKQGLRRFTIPEGVRYEDGILEYLPEDNLDKNKTTAFIPVEGYCEPKDYFYFELKLLVDSEVIIGVSKKKARPSTIITAFNQSNASFQLKNMPRFSSTGSITGKQKTFFVLECTTNDIMGVFLHGGQIIFTRNGTISASFSLYDKKLIPHINLAPGAKVYVNFGQIPYSNDITLFSSKLREKSNFFKTIEHFWSIEIKYVIEERYSNSLSESEKSSSQSLLQLITPLNELILRFEELSSIKFNPIVFEMSLQDNTDFKLQADHIDICSKSKPPPLLKLAEGIHLLYSISELDQDEGSNVHSELLITAIQKIKQIVDEFGLNSYRYNYYLGSAYFLKYIDEPIVSKREKYLSLSLLYLQKKPPYDENIYWKSRVTLQCAIVFMNKYEISRNLEDVLNAKELFRETFLQTGGKELLEEELIKINSKLTKSKTSSQIFSIISQLEILSESFSENNINCCSCLLLIFQIYWKAIYFIQMDYLKLDETREEWFDNSSHYFLQMVNFKKSLIDTEPGRKKLESFLTTKLSTSVSGTEICVLLEATLKIETLLQFLTPILVKCSSLVILHTNPLTSITLGLFKSNCKSDEVDSLLDRYLKTSAKGFVLEDIPVGYQLISDYIENINPINETDFNNINFNSGRFIVSKELKSPGSYSVTYSLQKYVLSEIKSLPGRRMTCVGKIEDSLIFHNFLITFNSIDILRIREILVKQQHLTSLVYEDECKLCYSILSTKEKKYTTQLCSQCWKDWACSVCGKNLLTSEKNGNGRCYQCNTCVTCKQEINFQNTTWRWCNTCYDFMTCLSCNKTLGVREKKDTNNLFFGHCFNCIKCSNCSHVLTQKEREFSTGVCDNCWDSLNCIHCTNKLSPIEKAYKFCTYCLNTDISEIICDYCGGKLSLEEKKYGNGICNVCYDFHYSCKKCKKELTSKEKKRGLQVCTYCMSLDSIKK